jgi:endoglucanase
MKPRLLTFFACMIAWNLSMHAASISEQIFVDQIGYRPASDKWFMIADPQIGQNSSVTYVPGSSVQLRRSSDNSIVRTIPLTAWNGGAVHSSSGDRVWQGQFNDVTQPGVYHLYDPRNDRQSWDFTIGDSIYNAILQGSVKSYYYQRSGTAITAEFGGQWTHDLAHIENQQASRLYDASLGGVQGANTARDVTGGWYDAGDYRKYTAWMADIIWDLGTAYEWWPEVFGDSSNIPESGNGVPDVLDEIKWEIDWMLKMQRDDGALYSGRICHQFGSRALVAELETPPRKIASITTPTFRLQRPRREQRHLQSLPGSSLLSNQLILGMLPACAKLLSVHGVFWSPTRPRSTTTIRASTMPTLTKVTPETCACA